MEQKLEIWKEGNDYYFDFKDFENKKSMDSRGINLDEVGTPGEIAKKLFDNVKFAFDTVLNSENEG